MKFKKRMLGFTLVEVLAVIFIISLVFIVGGGYYIFSVIDNSKRVSSVTSTNLLKKSASMYIKEYPDKIFWDENEYGYSNACISIRELYNVGYFKEKQISNYMADYVYVVRDNSYNVLSSEIDSGFGSCSHFEKVKVPTSKEVCRSNLVYNGNEQYLAVSNNSLYSFVDSTNKGTNAGNYSVSVRLNQQDGSVRWDDGTVGEKKVTCQIKKSSPVLIFSSYGIVNKVGEVGDVTVSVAGVATNFKGNLSIKSGNDSYVSAELKNSGTIDSSGNGAFVVKVLSNRKTTTYVTVTLNPKDLTNYNAVSEVYTVGEASAVNVDVPTQDLCSNPYYNGANQSLVRELDSNAGYVFVDSFAKDVGSYTVKARLKYGYVWNGYSGNDKYSDKTIDCSIRLDNYTVTFNGNGSTSGSMNNLSCSMSKDCKLSKNSFVRDGYHFVGWSTSSDGVKVYDDEGVYNNLSGATTVNLYAIWEENVLNIRYNGNNAIWKEGSTFYKVDSNNFAVLAGNGSMDVTKLKYGSSLSRSKKLLDYTYWKRSGYLAVDGKEWCTASDGTGSCFDVSSITYSANDLASAAGCDLKTNSSCVLNLYANWRVAIWMISNADYGADDLQRAVNLANDGAIISLQADKYVHEGNNEVWVSSQKVTIDNKGHDIIFAKKYLGVGGNGNLTMRGSGTYKGYLLGYNNSSVINIVSGNYTSYDGGNVISSKGSLNVTGGVITQSFNNSPAVNINDGVANFSNVSIVSTGSVSSAVSIGNDANVTVNSGTYTSKYNVFSTMSSGKLKINGGTIISSEGWGVNISNGKLCLNGGSVTGKDYSVALSYNSLKDWDVNIYLKDTVLKSDSATGKASVRLGPNDNPIHDGGC